MNTGETDDEDLLKQNFDGSNFLMDTVTKHLQDFEARECEAAEGLTERLARFLKDKWEE